MTPLRKAAFTVAMGTKLKQNATRFLCSLSGNSDLTQWTAIVKKAFGNVYLVEIDGNSIYSEFIVSFKYNNETHYFRGVE